MSAMQPLASARQRIESDSRSHLSGSHVRFSSKLAHKIFPGFLPQNRSRLRESGYLRIGNASPTDKKVERMTKLCIVRSFAPETRLEELHPINFVLFRAEVKP
jgi:hypothetical protein